MNPSRPSVIANNIRMLRSQFHGTFLLVEGRDDRLFMTRFICDAECKIVVVGGKQNVLEVIEILKEDDFEGVLGIVDADFDRIEGITQTNSSIVMPEGHDLETMLMYSRALDHVMLEYGSDEKISKLPGSPLDELVKRSLLIAYLRLHSLRDGLDLRFKDLKYSTWIDARTFEASKERLIESVKNHSQRHDLSSRELGSAMEELERAKFRSQEMCAGKDLIEIASLGLRRALGSHGHGSLVSSDSLRRSLRLAYSEHDFRSSSLCRDIQRWEKRGRGFRVLRRR